MTELELLRQLRDAILGVYAGTVTPGVILNLQELAERAKAEER